MVWWLWLLMGWFVSSVPNMIYSGNLFPAFLAFLGVLCGWCGGFMFGMGQHQIPIRSPKPMDPPCNGIHPFGAACDFCRTLYRKD